MLKFIAFALLLGLAYSKAPVAQTEKKVSNSGGTTQSTHADQRGTLESPLMVDARTIQSDKEAAEEAAKDAEQKRVNGWNIGLTFAIAICALLQFGGIIAQVVVYLKQTKIMRETLTAISGQAATMETQVEDARNVAAAAVLTTQATLNAIERQAKEMSRQNENTISKERARLRVQVMPLEYEWPAGLSIGPELKFKVFFYGITEAYIVSSAAWCHISDSEEPTMCEEFSILDLPPVIAKDTVIPDQSALIWPTLSGDVLEQVKSKTAFIHFYGIIRYRDVFEQDRETGFYYTWNASRYPATPYLSPAKWVKRECAGYDQET